MKQQLGDYEYEIFKETKNHYSIVFHYPDHVTKVSSLDCFEEDIDILINYLRFIREATPENVSRARKNGVCRVCNKKIDDGTAIRLDFGKEYAHERCVPQD